MSKKGAIDLSQGAKMLEGGREDFKDASVIPAAQGFTNLFHAVSNYDAGREAERLGARVRGSMREIQAASSEYYDKKNDLEDFRIRAGIESEISQFSSEIRNEIKASQGTNADGLHEKISKKWSEFSTRFDERLTQFNDPKVAEAVKLRIGESQIRDISDALGQQNEEGVKVAEQDFRAALDRVKLAAKKNPSLVFAEGGGSEFMSAQELGGLLVRAGASPALIAVSLDKARREAASSAFGTELDLAQAEGYKTGSMDAANSVVERYRGMVDDDVLAAAKKQNEYANNALKKQRDFDNRLEGSDMIAAGGATFSQNISEIKQFLGGNPYEVQKGLRDQAQFKALQDRVSAARDAARMRSEGYKKKGMVDAADASLKKDEEEISFVSALMLRLAAQGMSKPSLSQDKSILGPDFLMEEGK